MGEVRLGQKKYSITYLETGTVYVPQNSIADVDGFEVVFINFMDGMFEWESKYFQRKVDDFQNDSEPGLKDIMQEDLLLLFNEYVSKGGRNYDRVENLVCSSPPEYDRKHDQIETIHVGSHKVLVRVRQLKGLESAYRLTFLRKGGKFMLSKRELKYDERWCGTYI
jgi:hypothetical protein